MSQDKEIRVKIKLNRINKQDIENIFKLMKLPYSGDYLKDIVMLFGFIDLHYLGKKSEADYQLIKHLVE